MSRFNVVLKSLSTNERITLSTRPWSTRDAAEQSRKQWRKVLGGKNWTIDRRPGLDTLDQLALFIEEVK